MGAGVARQAGKAISAARMAIAASAVVPAEPADEVAPVGRIPALERAPDDDATHSPAMNSWNVGASGAPGCGGSVHGLGHAEPPGVRRLVAGTSMVAAVTTVAAMIIAGDPGSAADTRRCTRPRSPSRGATGLGDRVGGLLLDLRRARRHRLHRLARRCTGSADRRAQVGGSSIRTSSWGRWIGASDLRRRSSGIGGGCRRRSRSGFWQTTSARTTASSRVTSASFAGVPGGWARDAPVAPSAGRTDRRPLIPARCPSPERSASSACRSDLKGCHLVRCPDSVTGDRHHGGQQGCRRRATRTGGRDAFPEGLNPGGRAPGRRRPR